MPWRSGYGRGEVEPDIKDWPPQNDQGSIAPSFTNLYSCDFDGVDDRLNAGANVSLGMNTTAAAQPVSFSCWFKSSAGSGAVNLWWTDNWFAPYWSYSTIAMDSAGTILLQLQKGTWGKLTVSTAGWNDGNWHSLVYTWDATGPHYSNIDTGSTFYIDGSVEAHVRTGSIISAVVPAGVTRFFRGYSGLAIIGDEISIWNKELSSAEVTELYNSGTPTDLSTHSATADLEGWWRNGDGDTFPTILDHSGNGFSANMDNMSASDIILDVP